MKILHNAENEWHGFARLSMDLLGFWVVSRIMDTGVESSLSETISLGHSDESSMEIRSETIGAIDSYRRERVNLGF
jgi:hypothetical protein